MLKYHTEDVYFRTFHTPTVVSFCPLPVPLPVISNPFSYQTSAADFAAYGLSRPLKKPRAASSGPPLRRRRSTRNTVAILSLARGLAVAKHADPWVRSQKVSVSRRLLPRRCALMPKYVARGCQPPVTIPADTPLASLPIAIELE